MAIPAEILRTWHGRASKSLSKLKEAIRSVDGYQKKITGTLTEARGILNLLDELRGDLKVEMRNPDSFRTTAEKVSAIISDSKKIEEKVLELEMLLTALADQQKSTAGPKRASVSASKIGSEARQVVRRLMPIRDDFEALIDNVDDLIRELPHGQRPAAALRRIEVRADIEKHGQHSDRASRNDEVS